ncbi:LpxL/LpxP family acyltransferase [Parafilimonas terrae]|uniref:Predicted acyltransferase, LPLAT superfamily n=1 Tax=Parafilimonas terrae TaxID=1465490 RepID=A0A1I5Z784_9BACT|nr:lipid A biosynthesis acyltransferase [Parafilimonas terrae]SFQ52336.1 Predicted acyltransferase, LPLAT superfamily [Parafilimonas terrae]
MPSWQGSSKGTTLGYSIFVTVIKKFGVRPAYALLAIVAFYYFLFSFKTSKIIYGFYRERLHCGRLTSLLKLYKNYYRLGQTLIDKIAIMSGAAVNFTFNFDGEENLRSITALQKGGLLLSAHIGNWEIAGYLLKRLNTRINIVMFDGEHQKIKEYLKSVTGETTAKIIVIKNDLSHIFEINEALKNNELVCMHADRFVEGNKTVETGFLGSPAKFPFGPFLLAAKFKVPVAFVFALKETTFHYHFFSTGAKDYSIYEKDESIARMLKDFAEAMEEKVKAYPEQWFNYYDFWKE